MANSPKFTGSHHDADAPVGHRLPHAATMPSLSSSPPVDARNHKHYQSRLYHHIATPYPVLEHSATMSSISSGSPTGSTDYMQSHKHHHHRPSIPNPMRAVHDHMAELRYGHAARSAKREASKSQPRPWNLDASLARGISGVIEEKYEEIVEDWKERDEQAWAEELKKREKARRSCGGPPDEKSEDGIP